MSWATFTLPDDTQVPVNMARVTFVERLRSPGNPNAWSGNVRLNFSKDHYLDVKNDQLCQDALVLSFETIRTPKD